MAKGGAISLCGRCALPRAILATHRTDPSRLTTAALHDPFERLYYATFGYIAEGEPVELVNLRLSAIGTAASRLDFGGLRLDARALAGESGERLVSFARQHRGSRRAWSPAQRWSRAPSLARRSSRATTPPSSFRPAAPRVQPARAVSRSRWRADV